MSKYHDIMLPTCTIIFSGLSRAKSIFKLDLTLCIKGSILPAVGSALDLHISQVICYFLYMQVTQTVIL